MSDSEHAGAPVPGPEHALLNPFAGRFRATVKLHMGPGEPIIQHGTMFSTWQIGGLYLFQDYTGDPAPPPWPSFIGRGYWGYNQTAKRFEGFWIDNASTMMQLEHGQVDAAGTEWQMHSEFLHPQTGQPLKKRTRIRAFGPDRNDMTSWITGPDGSEQLTMEILFERVPG
jgi:hypothetical protein